jgi:hypothetical protein
VKFSKLETSYLRGVGFLHPMCSEESEMWMTMEEYQMLAEYPCFDSKEMLDVMDKELAKINKLIDKEGN